MSGSGDDLDDLLDLEIIEDDELESGAATDCWKVIIADDEPEVHRVTRIALDGLQFDGKQLEFLSAWSGAEAIELLRKNNDVALILLDVVMETDHAGLDAVKTIREELRNDMVRIVLRTGQPGQAPPRAVVQNYDINDYKSKAELSRDSLFIVVITSLRMFQREQRLRQREAELERSNRDLAQFAYITSHDLQEPLRTVHSFAQMLEKKYAPQLDDNGKKWFGFVTQGVARMHSMVQSLLIFSQLDQDQKDEGVIPLDGVLDAVCENIALQIEETGATIEYKDLPSLFIGCSLAELLFSNLIRNSLKFCDPSKKPHVRITSCVEADEHVISVTDNGIGFKQEYAEGIFNIFSRLHSREDYPGTGIGLAICRRIVEGYGGTISAQSAEGEGCTFFVRLPVSR